MIKEKDLSQLKGQIRFKNGSNITLRNIADELIDKAAEAGIPLATAMDQVKSGNIIKSEVADCLVLYHPNHKADYFYYVIRVNYQASYAFVDLDMAGSSKLVGLEMAVKQAKARSASGVADEFDKGLLMGAKIRSMITGPQKKKKTEEENWYLMVEDLLEEINL